MKLDGKPSALRASVSCQVWIVRLEVDEGLTSPRNFEPTQMSSDPGLESATQQSSVPASLDRRKKQKLSDWISQSLEDCAMYQGRLVPQWKYSADYKRLED